MDIDFSFSISDWMGLFDQFITVIESFFAKIGIKLFADEAAE